ncbi:Flp family type IVb pilin [Pseudarthrobacter sp. S6]|uniref:Flp family type IVb pilin n=1 Tax=Pseudarthrobacter sp. S6 TaxID=3418420 RepID=UPI003CF758C9
MKHITALASSFRSRINRIRGEELGATATEYSILAGFIALVIVAEVGAFGIALNGVFTGLGTSLKTALGIP